MIDVRTERVLAEALRRLVGEQGVLGATAAIRCEGLGAWTGASGSLGLDRLEPISVEARLPAYSITKTMTSVCVMRLAEIGLLNIGDPISRWVDELPFGDEVSLQQLLNHTAGVPNYSDLPEPIAALEASPGAAWSTDEFIAQTCQRGLDFAPGTGWAYSNTGYMLLKRAIERASGSSFGEAIQQHIAGPLGFSRTTVLAGLASFESLAPGYSRVFSSSGELQDVRGVYDPGWCATGVVASTAAELCEFYQALFSGKIVHRETLARMTDLVPVPGDHPPAVRPSYGLGLMGDPGARFGPEYGHGGGGPGYDLRAVCYPSFRERRVCGVVLCNSDEVQSTTVLQGLFAALAPELGETLTLS